MRRASVRCCDGEEGEAIGCDADGDDRERLCDLVLCGEENIYEAGAGRAAPRCVAFLRVVCDGVGCVERRWRCAVEERLIVGSMFLMLRMSRCDAVGD